VAPARLRLITFDLDDTLWEVRPVLERAEAEVAEWLSRHCPEVTARFDSLALARRRQALLRQRPELAHHISALRREGLREALLECGYAAAEAARLADAAFEVFIVARHAVEPFVEVERCLETLEQRYTLGVLTNGNADVFRLPLGRFFRFAIRAESLGTSKPDVRAFEAALAAAGVRADEALHVGDHPEHDVAGARRAGFDAVWFNPLARTWPGTEPAQAEFGDFAELPALVERLDAARR
jgi:putative hydrolase of the HAD superfamily